MTYWFSPWYSHTTIILHLIKFTSSVSFWVKSRFFNKLPFIWHLSRRCLARYCIDLDFHFVAVFECNSCGWSNTQCFMLLMITQRALHPVIRQYSSRPEVSITTMRRWVLSWRRPTQTNVYRLHVYLLAGTLIYLITGDRGCRSGRAAADGQDLVQ